MLQKAPSYSDTAGEKLAPCFRPELHATTAQSAYVVHAKPKQRAKTSVPAHGNVKSKNV